MPERKEPSDEKHLLREAQASFVHVGKELLTDLVILRRPLPEPQGMLMPLRASYASGQQ